MPIWKLQCSVWSDSVLARDAMVITPHFTSPLLADPQGICDDLAAALDAFTFNTHQIEVKAYDAQGSVPVYPAGQTMLNAGASPASPSPREVALCLSFYGTRNVKRQRGRVYVPAQFIEGALGKRPSGAAQTKAGTLAGIFSDLGGVDVDWCVYSRLNNAAYKATNWWVDDEWDTVRSRGLRATGRISGTTGE